MKFNEFVKTVGDLNDDQLVDMIFKIENGAIIETEHKDIWMHPSGTQFKIIKNDICTMGDGDGHVNLTKILLLEAFGEMELDELLRMEIGEKIKIVKEIDRMRGEVKKALEGGMNLKKLYTKLID